MKDIKNEIKYIVISHNFSGYNGDDHYEIPIQNIEDIEYARKDERKHERRIFIRILDEVWAEKGEAINKGLYAFTYEAVRGLIIDKLNENAEEDDEKYKGI